VLDPGAGTGILSAAVVEAICKKTTNCKQIFLTCYESCEEFIPMLEDNLERIRKKCRHDFGIKLYATVYNENYIVDAKNHYTVTFFDTVEDKFDIIIYQYKNREVQKMAVRLNDTYIKPFINEGELSALQNEINAAHKTLLAGTGEGNDFLGWIDLPTNYDKEEYARIKAAAAKIQKTCDVFVVIGIGGSYLGARAVV
jgi:hypothetical protein